MISKFLALLTLVPIIASWHTYGNSTGVSYIPFKSDNIPFKSDNFRFGTRNSNTKNGKVPSHFDARQRWPECETIKDVYDQSNCRSCWAVTAAMILTDRFCIASYGAINTRLSPQNLLSCCHSCTENESCAGSVNATVAYDYLKRRGIVTGGSFGSHEGCQPYRMRGCHHSKETMNRNNYMKYCAELDIHYADPDMLECQKKCYNERYKISYKEDLYKISKYYMLYENRDVMKEIYLRGPVQAIVTLYEDFYSYDGGVYYRDKRAADVGEKHSLRIIGWGKENGVPYWTAANTFNTYWGEEGIIKIARGCNECDIEDFFIAAIPLLPKTKNENAK